MLTQEQIDGLKVGDMVRHKSGAVLFFINADTGHEKDEYNSIVVGTISDNDCDIMVCWSPENCELVEG